MITKPGEKSEEQNKGIPLEEKINEESAFDKNKLFNSIQKNQMATGTTTETHINWSKYNILKNKKVLKEIEQAKELQKTIEEANSNTSSTIPPFAALIALSKVVFTQDELENYEKNDILNAITRETEIGLNKKQKELKEEYEKKLFDYVNEEIMPKEITLDKLKEELEQTEKSYNEKIGHAKPEVIQGYEKAIETAKLMIGIKEYIEKQPDTNIFKNYTEFKKYFNGKSIQGEIQLGEENTGSLIKNEKELEKLKNEILNTCIDVSSIDALRNYIINNKNSDGETEVLLKWIASNDENLTSDEKYKILKEFAEAFGVNYNGKLLLPPLTDDQKTALEIAYWSIYIEKEKSDAKGVKEDNINNLEGLSKKYFELLEKGNADLKELENLTKKISEKTAEFVVIKLQDESFKNSLKIEMPDLKEKIENLSSLYKNFVNSALTDDQISDVMEIVYKHISIQFNKIINDQTITTK